MEPQALARGRAVPDATPEPLLQLTLYVSGASACSTSALLRLKHLCEQELPGRYSLRVVDIHSHPEALSVDQIVAIPTLIRRWPLPERRVIGDLRDEEPLRAILDLPPRP